MEVLVFLGIVIGSLLIGWAIVALAISTIELIRFRRQHRAKMQEALMHPIFGIGDNIRLKDDICNVGNAEKGCSYTVVEMLVSPDAQQYVRINGCMHWYMACWFKKCAFLPDSTEYDDIIAAQKIMEEMQ